MSRRRKPVEDEGAFDLIERAVHLLRTTPLSSILLFYVGAIPFILAVLFFLADMSSSPFADERCAGAALGVGLLYIWMRTWQALFCNRLIAQLKREPPEPVTPLTFLRIFRFHLIYSSWGLILLPLAALCAVPFAWIYAYFNNLCVVNPSSETEAEAVRKARALAKPRPKQNHLIISILTGFACFIFLNWISVIAQLPSLLKSLVGIETPFSQSMHWMFNTTFWGIAFGLTYLVAEPLFKAAYVLRFHSCESIETGEDLVAELKSLPSRMAAALRILLIGFVLFGCSISSPAEKMEDGAQETTSAVNQIELDEAVDRVMKQREFTWRMPRELTETEEDQGFFGKFMESVFNWIEDMGKSMGEAIERFFEKLGDSLTPDSRRQSNTPGLDPAFFKGLSVTLLVVLVAVLGVFLVRAWLARRKPLAELEQAEAATIKVDLEDESIIATLLEEDEWISLARELAAAGEFRKAARAWFLAGLAFLSRKDLLSILHSKSNLEYRRELIRRARRCPQVVPVFGKNISLFERVWYGLYSATPDDLKLMEENVERMRHEA